MLHQNKFMVVISLISGIVLTLCGCLPGTSTQPVTTESPEGNAARLSQYVLDLINEDRVSNNRDPVIPGTNTAAQSHADDMLADFYLSHWDSDGSKPYMRYTIAGGINYEAENCAYHGWYDAAQDPDLYVTIDPEDILKQLEFNMMYDDEDSNWGHRETILNPLNKVVSIGIAYDKHRLVLVQQFEGDYVVFNKLPAIVNSKLSLAGSLSLGKFYSLCLFYDPLPQPITQQQLMDKPHSYDHGQEIGYVLPPKTRMEDKDYVNATEWNIDNTGSFDIEADIGPLLKYQKGVYTISLVSDIDGALTSLSNYSIFVR